MIHPNFTLLLWVILAAKTISALNRIVGGAFGVKKINIDKYGMTDVISGFVWLLVLAVVVFI